MIAYKCVCKEQRDFYDLAYQWFLTYYTLHTYYKNHKELKWMSEPEERAFTNTNEYRLKEDWNDYKRRNNLYEAQHNKGAYINPKYAKLSEELQIENYKRDFENLKQAFSLAEYAQLKATFQQELGIFNLKLSIYNEEGVLHILEDYDNIPACEAIDESYEKIKPKKFERKS